MGVFASAPIIGALAMRPRQSWRGAIEVDGSPREGAQVAQLTRSLRPPQTLAPRA